MSVLDLWQWDFLFSGKLHDLISLHVCSFLSAGALHWPPAKGDEFVPDVIFNVKVIQSLLVTD